MLTLLLISLGLIALLALRVAVVRRRRRRMASEVRVLVERMFDQPADAPALEFGSSYGWPTFTLVFPTAEARSRLTERGTIGEFD